ncbi:MAG: hypothetical protein ACI8Z0_000979, partial [Lentimonas sp.]
MGYAIFKKIRKMRSPNGVQTSFSFLQRPSQSERLHDDSNE